MKDFLHLKLEFKIQKIYSERCRLMEKNNSMFKGKQGPDFRLRKQVIMR